MTEREKRVRRRARYRCEYCRLPQLASRLSHQIDHIIARQHGGRDDLSNCALSCARCNLHKGPNIAGIDPNTGEIVRLYSPRSDRWPDHFEWQDAILLGLTPVGRTTIHVLALNDPGAVAVRAALIAEGLYPRT